MAFKAIDFECNCCRWRGEDLVDVPHGAERPKSRIAYCPVCRQDTAQSSLQGLPAPYMGERVCNPQVFGGACDTMGHREPPPLPDLPGAAEHQSQVAARMRHLADDASAKEKKAAFHDASRDAPSSADYATLFASREYKRAEAEREQVKKQNVEKRARASAFAKGEPVNFKRDKCAGDPTL